jgi:REP element-mobilizing transposase RayT
VEYAGALYHVITRGNNRQAIFKDEEDHRKFLALLEREKQRHPFYLYAYVLMTNHVHLLLERQDEPLSRVMQRVLTGYARYWNRKYRKVGHLFQGRYKAMLCQKEAYMSELVRYIHLNPVRAKLVRRAEDYRWSSHRAYLGQVRTPWVDSEVVLRYFGATKKRAVQMYRAFIAAGSKQGHRVELYAAAAGRFLGSDEFVDEMKRRLGEAPMAKTKRRDETWAWSEVVRRVEQAMGLRLSAFQGRGRVPATLAAKEALIYVGRERGGFSYGEIARRLKIDPSTVGRGYERAQARLLTDQTFRQVMERILVEKRNTHA